MPLLPQHWAKSPHAVWEAPRHVGGYTSATIFKRKNYIYHFGQVSYRLPLPSADSAKGAALHSWIRSVPKGWLQAEPSHGSWVPSLLHNRLGRFRIPACSKKAKSASLQNRIKSCLLCRNKAFLQNWLYCNSWPAGRTRDPCRRRILQPAIQRRLLKKNWALKNSTENEDRHKWTLRWRVGHKMKWDGKQLTQGQACKQHKERLGSPERVEADGCYYVRLKSAQADSNR